MLKTATIIYFEKHLYAYVTTNLTHINSELKIRTNHTVDVVVVLVSLKLIL